MTSGKEGSAFFDRDNFESPDELGTLLEKGFGANFEIGG
jgi:hypothetical protein